MSIKNQKLPLSPSPRLPSLPASLPSQPRRSPRFRLGWASAGIVGAAVVGGAIAASNDGYYYNGYRRCGWVASSMLRQLNRPCSLLLVG